MSRSTPPNKDEFEISIIGPGRGECVIVHLGNNEWCVVDSCVPRGSSKSVAIEYLSSFKNGALDRVRLIVATHWHDDHIHGLASILRQVPTASFCCSAALNTENFFALVGIAETGGQRNSGVDEFVSILETMAEKTTTPQAKRRATPMWATEHRSLLQLNQRDGCFPATVTALSPSDSTIKLAFADLARLLPQTGDKQRRVTNRSPNHTSVVLWIEAGSMRALLGADLEHTSQSDEGWMAVVKCHHDPQSAALFKVPHHGSTNADYPQVWTQMLVENPIAVVTPFTGGKSLPRQSDLFRLAKRTTSLYCTAPSAGKVPSREALVEKTMRRQVIDRRVIEGNPGHVRVRWSLTNYVTSPVIELFNGAYQIIQQSPAISQS